MPLCYSVPPLVQETCQDKLSEEVIPRSCIHADCNMDMPCFAVTSRRAVASILLRVRSKACCCLLLNGILAWSSPCQHGLFRSRNASCKHLLPLEVSISFSLLESVEALPG